MKYNKEILKVEQSKIREFNNIAHQMGAKYYMTLGEPDFNTPENIKDACKKALDENKTKYSHTLGSLDLRKAISSFEYKTNKINYSPEEIIITMGSTEALTTSLLTILNEGDEVIVPTPCYALYRPIIEYAKAKMVTIDTTTSNFQITKEQLDKVINKNTKAILLTNPNNPTGYIYNKETLQILHDALVNKEIWIILDNCYSQLVYAEYHNLYEYDDLKEQIIICQSFSKPYAMTGWRIGYLMGNKDFCLQAAKIHQYVAVAANTFIQPAAIEALNFDPTPFINSYKERRDYALKRLEAMGMEFNIPEGAFYIFPSIKKYGLKSWDFCLKLLEKYKVATIPGICFEADDYIRLSYCVDMDTIIHCLDALEDFIKTL